MMFGLISLLFNTHQLRLGFFDLIVSDLIISVVVSLISPNRRDSVLFARFDVKLARSVPTGRNKEQILTGLNIVSTIQSLLGLVSACFY